MKIENYTSKSFPASKPVREVSCSTQKMLKLFILKLESRTVVLS